ncbi:DUF2339 domain-containing protein [Corynebacterium cystitidis]|uniref:DUF2339 domain-containing protein n=1 Tax=Corynebacterium cystitidis TaxID=35757 RepID=UPI00211DF33C|nr:DUF2339 domain-containing protein [Corynebacterium cystitidis]
MHTPPSDPGGENNGAGKARDADIVLRNARASLQALQRAVDNTHGVIHDLERLTLQLQELGSPAAHNAPSAPKTQPVPQPQAPQSAQSAQSARATEPVPVQTRVLQQAPLPKANKPARPELTTEQLIMRIIAVLGSLITVIGVGLGITLAIQSGLLGPLGRVILSVLLAIALAAGGLLIERKQGNNTGSSTLHITSQIVLVLVILSLVFLLEWWPRQAGVVAALALFIGWLVFGRVRSNGAVLIATGLLSFCYLPAFVDTNMNLDTLLYLAPLVLLFFTVSAPGKSPVPNNSVLRLLAPLMACFFYGIIARGAGDVPIPVLFIGIGFVLIAIAIEAAFPPAPLPPEPPLPGVTDDKSQPQVRLPWVHVAQLTVFPIIILLSLMFSVEDYYLWAFPAVAAVALYLVSHLYRTAPQLGPRRGEALTWLVFGAFTFIPIYVDFGAGADANIRRYITLAVFLAAFFGVILLLEQRPQYREVTWLAWTATALYLTWTVSVGVLALRETTLVQGAVQLQAVCLALLLVFALWRSTALQGMHPVVLGVAGIVGMHLYMVAMVSFITFAFHFFGAATTGVIVGHMLVSISWIVLAAWILLGKTRWSDKFTLRVGFVLAIAASIKLVFYDLASLSGIPQVLAFIASGVMLIVIAALRGRTTATSASSAGSEVSGARYDEQPGPQQAAARELP